MVTKNSINNHTFADIPQELGRYDNAAIVIVPVPYDGTSTWMKGADKGPAAFLDAARNMELYDIETRSEAYRHGIHLDVPVTENESPERMVEAVHKRVAQHLKNGKFITPIGGEHSISIGSLRAFLEYYPQLTILQLDAHADLRESYDGSTCNHACALHEAGQRANLIQVGIRSMAVEEEIYMDRTKTFFADSLFDNEHWIDRAIDMMSANVYITIDLDVFDPSIMPATGTPEPGGMLWGQVIKFLREVIKSRNVVGFDMSELCPNEISKASDFMAAKLYYKMISYKFGVAP